MAKKEKSAMQWKVVKEIQLRQLERTCEEWTGKGWNLFAVLGPLNGGFALMFNRMLTL